MELANAGENHKQLRAIAQKLIEKAATGDMQAIVELANRTDGKPSQQVDIDATVRFEDLLDQLK